MADQGRCVRIELWFRRHKISNPSIYATVGGHEAMVSMVALGCGVALLPEVVLENSPEPVRNRVMILERSDEKRRLSWAFAQKKRLHEPLIDAFRPLCPTTNGEEKPERRVMVSWHHSPAHCKRVSKSGS
jgi:LysR family positive regulator for ilvC